MTAPERPPFRLADEEREDLLDVLMGFRECVMGYSNVLAHVTELCAAYRDQGLVEGDLAHDGTIRAEAAAE